MSLLFGRQQRAAAAAPAASAASVVPARSTGSSGGGPVTLSTAMTHSAVWGATRLRANLISTLPVDTYRRSAGTQVEMPTPAVLVKPGGLLLGGESVDIDEWLFATQMDLDRSGNTVGVIVARDGLGFPSRIDLVPIESVTVRVKDGVITYHVGRKQYTPFEVWHERQYVVPGVPVGLSPIAHAAMSIHQYLSAQQFVQDWYASGGKPAAHLKNTGQTITPLQASDIKARHEATVRAGEVMVTGKDWDYNLIAAKANESDFLGTQRFSVIDLCRFLDVPGDMIDAPSEGSSITYANITQRMVQLLVAHLHGAITRRERRLSSLMAAPRYVKLNSDALLRMDPLTRAQVLKTGIDGRWVTPDEVRELDDRQPLTPEQIALFGQIFNAKGATPASPLAPGGIPA